MNQPDQASLVALAFFVALATWTVLVVWTFGTSRKQLARRVPYERRRPVPWGGIEVVLLLGLFLMLPLLVAVTATRLFDVPAPAAAEQPTPSSEDQQGEAGEAAEQRGNRHPVERLLREDHSVWALMISGLMAVLMAPIIEEFLFRVVFQGWLEKVENRNRRRFVGLRALPGAVPVLLSSLFFAAMHIPPETQSPAEVTLFMLGCQAVASLVTLPLAILTLRLGSGATWSDMGFVPSQFGRDVVVGLVSCMAVLGPIYLLFIVIQVSVPEGAAAAPIALIPLALTLGTLYYRSHRIVASIILHMAFNAAGLAALLTLSR